MGRLDGRVVATTRDGSADDPLTLALRAEGADVRVWPTIATREPADPEPFAAALRSLDEYDWIVFTSARAVDAVAHHVPTPPSGPRLAAVARATAAALERWGRAADLVGTGEGARGLLEAFAAHGPLSGARVLFPAASLARDTVERELSDRGARVERVEAYRTVEVPPDAERVRADLARGVDVVAFASPSAVRSLAGALDGRLAEALAGCEVVAIGPTTAAALREAGRARVELAPDTSVQALVDACAAHAHTP